MNNIADAQPSQPTPPPPSEKREPPVIRNASSVEKYLSGNIEFRKITQENPARAKKIYERMMSEAQTNTDGQLPQLRTQPEPGELIKPGPINQLVRPTLEGGAGMLTTAGTAIATGNPALSVAAGGLAIAGASALSDYLETLGGERAALRSIGDAMGKTIEHTATGIGAEMTGFGVARAIPYLSPISEKTKEAGRAIIKLGDKYGVTFSPAEIFQSKGLLLVESALDNLAFSSSQIEQFRLGQLNQLVKVRENMLTKGGTKEEIEVSGMKIRDEIEKVLAQNKLTQQAGNNAVRQGLLAKLGSHEKYEALGKTAQEAVVGSLKARRDQRDKLFNTAYDLLPPNPPPIEPNRLTAAHEKVQKELGDTDPMLLPPVLKKWLNWAGGKGNTEGDLARQQISHLAPEAQAKFIRDNPDLFADEGLSFTPQGMKAAINLLRDAIDSHSASLSLFGRPGVPGVGKSGQNSLERWLIQLKVAAQEDTLAYADQVGGGFKGALTLALAESKDFKRVARNPDVISFLQAAPEDAVRVVSKLGLEGIRVLRDELGPTFDKTIGKGTINLLMGTDKKGQLTANGLRGTINRLGIDQLQEILGHRQYRDVEGVLTWLENSELAPIGNNLFRTLAKTSPEKVVENIVRPNNIENLRLIEQHLGKDTLKGVAQAYLNLLTPSKNTTIGRFFQPSELVKNVESLGERTMRKLFQHDPSLVGDIKEISTLFSRAHGAEHFVKQVDTTPQGLMTFITGRAMAVNPAIGLKIAAIPNMIAKIYNSPTLRKLLVRVLSSKPGSHQGAAVTTKFLGLLTKDQVEREGADRKQRLAFQPQTPSATQLALAYTHPYGTPAGANPSRQGPY